MENSVWVVTDDEGKFEGVCASELEALRWVYTRQGRGIQYTVALTPFMEIDR